jgi:phosphoglycolate phosphatase-like HAD superfamily hydrolase
MLPSFGGRLLFEGCGELLTRLKERGISLHIASTGDRVHVFSILNGTGINGFFETVSCGRPDKTEMLREMIEKKKKKEFIMVGDMKKDYEAARANGIVSVGACYGYCIKDKTDFDYYLSAPLDLLKIFE